MSRDKHLPIMLPFFAGLLLCAAPGACEAPLAELPAAALKQEGEGFFNAGNPAAALPYFDELLRRDPEDLEALNSRGKLYSKLKRPAESELDLTQAITLIETGQRPPGKVSLAHLYHRRSYAREGLTNIEGALADVEQALKLDSRYRNAWASRGYFLTKMMHFDEAVESHERALELDPNYLVSRIDLVHIAIERKDYEYASHACDGWREVAEHEEQWVYAGGLKAEDLARPVPVDPHPAMFYSNCAVAKRQVNDEEGRRDFLTFAASAEVRDAGDHAVRARARRDLDQLDAALADFNQAVARETENIDFLLGRANVLYRLGRYAEAEQDYELILRLNPQSADALAGRALVRSTYGLLPQAEADARRAVALESNSGNWEALGWIHSRQKEWQAAETDLTKALELDPGSTWARSARADARLWLERYDEAISDYDQVLKKGDDAQVYYRRAWAKSTAGRPSEALLDINKANELHPNLPEAKTLAQRIALQVKYESPGSSPRTDGEPETETAAARQERRTSAPAAKAGSGNPAKSTDGPAGGYARKALSLLASILAAITGFIASLLHW